MAAIDHVRPSVVREHEIPGPIRAASEMTDPDYIDLFTVPVTNPQGLSPERCARLGLETASRLGRFVAWEVLCALRLHTEPSPDRVAGWRIADRGDDWIRLEASSWYMTAHVVVHVDDHRLAIALFVSYNHPLGRVLWPPISIVHRRAMPGLMRHTARMIARQRTA